MDKKDRGTIMRPSVMVWFILLIIALTPACLSRDSAYTEKPLTKVKIGYHPAMCLTGLYVAKDLGMFSEAGIDAEIIEYQGGPPMIPAFNNGEIDMGFLGGPPAISAIDKGVDISIYAMAHLEGSAIIVSADSNLEKVEDLEGKTVAVPVYGSIQDVLLRIVLKNHGMDPSLDVELIEAGEFGGVSQLPALLQRGEIDAYVAWPPYNEIPLVEGYGKVLLAPDEMVPANPCCVIAARNSFVDENPEIFKDILQIVKDATVYALANPEKAAKSVNNVVGFNETVALASLEFSGKYCILPTNRTVEKTMEILQRMEELGYIEHNLTKERVFNLKYVYEVHSEPVHIPSANRTGQ
jgi:NitT/TauT family transport system substrate-binding protein